MLDGDPQTTVPLRGSPITGDVSAPFISDFEIVRLLGGGGMGVVFEARHHIHGHRVALKFHRQGAMHVEQARARLLREARVMSRIRHPNVVELLDVGNAGEDVFIAMELVDGGTLRDWMRAPHDWREVVDMFIAFGRGLAKAHALGVVHRDVNPSNVFLGRDGTPKLGDFGLAVCADDDDDLDDREVPIAVSNRLTAPGSVLGTPGYMAPEQQVGTRADARSDQYAFCVSLYEALTGVQPEPGPQSPLVPRPIRTTLMRGLAGDPRERFPSMTALFAALSRARRGRRRSVVCAASDAATTLTYGA
jgi:serine/threonine protein kinase